MVCYWQGWKKLGNGEYAPLVSTYILASVMRNSQVLIGWIVCVQLMFATSQKKLPQRRERVKKIEVDTAFLKVGWNIISISEVIEYCRHHSRFTSRRLFPQEIHPSQMLKPSPRPHENGQADVKEQL